MRKYEYIENGAKDHKRKIPITLSQIKLKNEVTLKYGILCFKARR
jgi:hypothetical protein